MSTIALLPRAGFRRVPWKNGGGWTDEIAVWPPGAGIENFSWRLSMARIDQSGPFSSFAGIERCLLVLEGDGFTLEVDGHAPAQLTRTAAPFVFDGGTAAHAALTAGPVTDLNIMTRPDAHADVFRGALGEVPAHLWSAPQLVLLAEEPLTAFDMALGRLDALLLTGIADRSPPHGAEQCILISLTSNV